MGFIGDAFDKVVDTARDVVTDPIGTVVEPVRDQATDTFNDVRDTVDFGGMLDTVVDTLESGRDAVVGVAQDTHHALLDEVPLYRAADGVVHDIKHEISETDWSDPDSIRDGAGDILGSTIIRGVQGAADTVEETLNTSETFRLDDFDDATNDYVRDIFGDSVEYEDARIVVGSVTTDPPIGGTQAPHVVGNTVYIPENYVETNDAGERTINEDKLDTFGHEFGHVWQNQNGGGDYAADAIGAQVEAHIETGDRNNAYHGTEALEDGTAFADLNPEEQADVAEEIGVILAEGGTLNQLLADAHEQILNGEGAP